MKKKDRVTENDAYRFYQKSSIVSGERADQLAWMFIVMMTGVLISGHVYSVFSVCAALACIYMLLSVLQSMWQAIASWIFKNRINQARKVCEATPGCTFVNPEDYPDYMGFFAWVFYYSKMAVITADVVYFAYNVFTVLA